MALELAPVLPALVLPAGALAPDEELVPFANGLSFWSSPFWSSPPKIRPRRCSDAGFGVACAFGSRPFVVAPALPELAFDAAA